MVKKRRKNALQLHFYMEVSGSAHKQNMHYWSGSNLHVLHESSLHPEKITVWCGLWAGCVIGPYVFRDDQDRYEHYRSMVNEYF